MDSIGTEQFNESAPKSAGGGSHTILANELPVDSSSYGTIVINGILHLMLSDDHEPNTAYDNAMKMFSEDGNIYFFHRGSRFMVGLHVDGKMDRGALRRATAHYRTDSGIVNDFNKPTSTSAKPDGFYDPYLWLSSHPNFSNFSWAEFYRDNFLSEANSNVKIFLVCISLDEHILEINTDQQLLDFETKYGANFSEYYGDYGEYSPRNINWHRVDDDGYRGVSIMRYLVKMRPHLWYNGWDVDSLVYWGSTKSHLLKYSKFGTLEMIIHIEKKKRRGRTGRKREKNRDRMLVYEEI